MRLTHVSEIEGRSFTKLESRQAVTDRARWRFFAACALEYPDRFDPLIELAYDVYVLNLPRNQCAVRIENWLSMFRVEPVEWALEFVNAALGQIEWAILKDGKGMTAAEVVIHFCEPSWGIVIFKDERLAPFMENPRILGGDFQSFKAASRASHEAWLEGIEEALKAQGIQPSRKRTQEYEHMRHVVMHWVGGLSYEEIARRENEPSAEKIQKAVQRAAKTLGLHSRTRGRPKKG